MSTGLLIISLVLLAIVAPFITKYLKNSSGWIYSLFPLAGLIYYLSILGNINQGEVFIERYEWLTSMGIDFSFYVDGFSLLFSLLILGIGSFILVYAGYYMRPYPLKGRFLAYVLLFMAAMQGVVVSGNLITMFVFWELTSISSYLLIGYNHEKPEARAAALQALLITGIGGLALLAGFVLIGMVYDSYELNDILSRPGLLQNSNFFIPAMVLIIIGAFTKSAQFPFHFWLPNAMEAPSPVSAYLHSATMVKAGIFLLARLNPVFGDSAEWHYVLSLAGSVTMFAGAWLSITQNDLKRILAYTTVSGLGTLVLLIGSGTEFAVNAAIIFLLVHALYKGTLFMMAGNIEKMTGTRDLTQLGGLYRFMPFAAAIMIMALVSMAGIPPMIGFIGKELLYEAQISTPGIYFIIVPLGVFTNVVMVFLSLRLSLNIFWGKTPTYAKIPKEPPVALVVGPFVLMAISLLLGLFPSTMANPLTSKAITAISPGMDAVKLKLWHGINLVFILSMFTIFLGLMAYRFRAMNVAFAEKITMQYFHKDYAKMFGNMIEGFLRYTKGQTRLIQHGYHRFYLMTIFVVASFLVWYQIWRSDSFILEINFSEMPLNLVAVVILIVAATFSAVVSHSRVVALIALGIIGFGITIIFISFSGTDLAITMILVEILVVILAMAVLYHLPGYRKYSSTGARMRDALVATLVGGFMMVLVLQSGTSQLDTPISDFFKMTSLTEAFGRNIVNVILVDFRALDTLGEITVIAVAALGIFSMIKLGKKKNERKY